ncbi:MAG: hypothetical protein Q9203_005626 [Teloschistes exilis]
MLSHSMPDAAESHLSSRIHPLNSIVESPTPNESHQVPTRIADEGTSLQTTSDQAAHSSPAKPSPPPPEPQSSPGTPSTDLQQLGVELYSQLPPALQRLVSPLFVEPYSNPSSIPTSYQPRLTSAFFREAFREDLFDLEMMASHQVNAKEPVDPAWVKTRLRAYGLLQGDESAINRYAEVLQAAKAVVDRPRDSFPHDQDVELFGAKLERCRDANEHTFLNQILPFFIKETRCVPACHSRASEFTVLQRVLIEQSAETSMNNESEADPAKLARVADLTESEERVSISFFRSGMIELTNRDFSRTLPFFHDDTLFDKDLNKDMEKDAHVTNPRPDRTYGVDLTTVIWPEGFILPAKVQLLMEVVRSCLHIFLILEEKSFGGNIVEARNQVCRGGAITINTERQLRKKLGMLEKARPDLNTFMISVVLIDQIWEVWILWAELHAPDPKRPEKPLRRPTYHMNCVFVEALAKEGGLRIVRRVLHNIMDWVVGERLEKLRPLHKAIVEYADNRNLASGKQRKRQKRH